MSEMIGNEVKKNFCAPARRFGIFSPFGFRARLFSFLPRPSGGSKKKKEVFFYVSQCSLEASAKTTNIVKWVSVGAIVVLFGVIAVICIKGKKRYDAKHIAFAGISLSLSFVLSLIKVSPVTYGGSITLASFVPLLIYTYVYGLADGLLTGLIFGLFNFVTGPYILTPLTFILDYLLAFASIGLMGIAGKFTKKTTFNVVLGTVAVYVVRFVFHLFSGMIYFSMDQVWVELPNWAVSNGGFVYSFIYQCVYLPADCAIAAVAMYVLAKTNVLDKLGALMKPKKYATVKTETTKTAGAADAGIKVNAGDGETAEGETAAADTRTANGKS